MTTNRLSKPLSTPVALVLALSALVLAAAACSPQGPPASPEPSSTTDQAAAVKPEFMFVQIAENLGIDEEASTLRLVNVGQQTLYFADRPERIAGSLKMAEYLEEWTSQAGDDNFGADPPNATLSVYEPGQPDTTLAVVGISDPQIDGSDLVYTYSLLDGTLPATGGPTTLFIDWIGVGGGVGPGYHGVGVGRRGPGVR